MGEANYIAVEGVIGVGKTTLAGILAERLGAQKQLEEVEENPFLEKFYGDMRGYAFQTQIFFLLSRYRQQMDLTQASLFAQKTVSDYIFAKDRIFAHINLNDEELALYQRLADILEKSIARPDVVVYLQAGTDMLMERIHRRGRPFEKTMPRDYIETLNQAYNYFFFHYEDTPLIIVHTESVDFVNNPAHVDRLIEMANSGPKGTVLYGGGGE
ncbi:MAG: deoxynucleoside kinase [bacterium]|jgi:deoxyadenosine/deoxycytidine kinase